MINNDELLFVVDENNKPLEPLTRREAHAKGLWHRTSHIWIINSRNQLLCQKRSLLKDMHPGEWEAFFGGHQPATEKELESALNELEEELNIKAKPSDLKFYQVYKKVGRGHPSHNEFLYIYLYHWDGEVTDLRLEPDEVEKVEWKNLEEVKAKTDNKSPDWTHHAYEKNMIGWIEKQLNRS